MSPNIAMVPHSPSSRGEAQAKAIALLVERDAEKKATGWNSTSPEPWLRLEIEVAGVRGRWIELTYDMGLADAITRPLLRCVTPDTTKDELLPGAIFGRAIWIGKVPERTKEILISPTNAPGPFSFRIVSVRILSLAQLAAKGWGARPNYVLLGLALGAMGDAFHAERQFRRALHSTPLSAKTRWAAARCRVPEWDKFDALPKASVGGPHIRVIATRGEEEFVAPLLAKLRAQPWPHWSLAAPQSEHQDGVIAFKSDAPLAGCIADLHPCDLVLAMRPDEEWTPEALTQVGAAALRDDSEVYYGDEDITGPFAGLRLKPDWSPILAKSTDLTGRAWACRAGWAARAIGPHRAMDIADDPLPVEEGLRVTHLRRVLVRRPESDEVRSQDAPRPPSLSANDGPSATIIIPTRDRVDLLRCCVKSLRHVEGRADFEVVLVDNGSEKRETLAYLRDLGRDHRFRVLRRPGPFNFSALCNAGAGEARSGTLVFLNNDTEARSAGWLDGLIAWTSLPSVGAVGAKLLYPDGRLQHAGIVIGVDGHATHFERFRPPHDPGFFRRTNVPHEVSAVTGACLAVEKAKFDAIKGFDAVNLPIEFSDVDLCLRLAEHGWTALIEPAAVLIHHEAATRKVWRSQEKRYAGQVAYFKSRWRRAIRDDPYFHPALSLDWHVAALG